MYTCIGVVCVVMFTGQCVNGNNEVVGGMYSVSVYVMVGVLAFQQTSNRLVYLRDWVSYGGMVILVH